MTDRNVQWTQDWDKRFESGDTPWEEDIAPDTLEQLVKKHAQQSDRILEVGCGMGANVNHFSKNGYTIQGCDISKTAIHQAQQKYSNISDAFFHLDIYQGQFPLDQQWDIIIDRGCLHSFKDAAARATVFRHYAQLLTNNGKILMIAGNADNGDSIEQIIEYGLPRLSANDITNAAQKYFSIIEMKQCRYSHIEHGMTDFLAWSVVLEKRM